MKKLVLMLSISSMISISKIAQQKKDFITKSKAEYNSRMQWFVDSKYGMFIHFGLYSQLAMIGSLRKV